MLLTLTTTHRPATDLGYLLEKHPARTHRFKLAWGSAHVFFPEAREDRCTAALLLDVDPIRLVKAARRRGDASLLAHYVNDRPYAASSLLSVAIAQVLSSALHGKSRERPALAESPIELEAHLPAIACGGGRAVHELFEPLGYSIDAAPVGGSAWSVTLRAHVRLRDLLSHLYVLVPVLDDEKHYFVGLDEVDKLIARGEGWLAAHPARERIAERYLRRHRHLVRETLARLPAEEDPDPEATRDAQDEGERRLERRASLDSRRRDAVVEALRAHGARRVLDLGCGDGKLVAALLTAGAPFDAVVGMEVSPRSLERASTRLQRLPASARERGRLLHGSAVYRDSRMRGFDAITLVEVIEHVDPPRLEALSRVVFEHAAPRLVLITTPNREHNVLFPGLAEGALRHGDHRFEWTRAELAAWAEATAARFGYGVALCPIGDEDPIHGAPTQMALFTRGGEAP